VEGAEVEVVVEEEEEPQRREGMSRDTVAVRGLRVGAPPSRLREVLDRRNAGVLAPLPRKT
jgi:hypothetical protein